MSMGIRFPPAPSPSVRGSEGSRGSSAKGCYSPGKEGVGSQEQERWKDAMKILNSEYVAAMESEGLPGYETAIYIKDIISKHNE